MERSIIVLKRKHAFSYFYLRKIYLESLPQEHAGNPTIVSRPKQVWQEYSWPWKKECLRLTVFFFSCER